MRGALVLLLIPALIATSSAGSLLHTHVYAGHHHPEHHHGLAAHEHHEESAQRGDNVSRLEGCDPGKHTVSFLLVCAAVPQVFLAFAAALVPALPTPDIQHWQPLSYGDVRAHGPPPRAQASPRAPPLIALA